MPQHTSLNELFPIEVLCKLLGIIGVILTPVATVDYICASTTEAYVTLRDNLAVIWELFFGEPYDGQINQMIDEHHNNQSLLIMSSLCSAIQLQNAHHIHDSLHPIAVLKGGCLKNVTHRALKAYGVITYDNKMNDIDVFAWGKHIDVFRIADNIDLVANTHCSEIRGLICDKRPWTNVIKINDSLITIKLVDCVKVYDYDLGNMTNSMCHKMTFAYMCDGFVVGLVYVHFSENMYPYPLFQYRTGEMNVADFPTLLSRTFLSPMHYVTHLHAKFESANCIANFPTESFISASILNKRLSVCPYAFDRYTRDFNETEFIMANIPRQIAHAQKNGFSLNKSDMDKDDFAMMHMVIIHDEFYRKKKQIEREEQFSLKFILAYYKFIYIGELIRYAEHLIFEQYIFTWNMLKRYASDYQSTSRETLYTTIAANRRLSRSQQQCICCASDRDTVYRIGAWLGSNVRKIIHFLHNDCFVIRQRIIKMQLKYIKRRPFFCGRRRSDEMCLREYSPIQFSDVRYQQQHGQHMISLLKSNCANCGKKECSCKFVVESVKDACFTANAMLYGIDILIV